MVTVIAIESDKTIFEACNKYKHYKVGCLIVTENDECIGMLTERDLIERTICESRDPLKATVKEIMTTDIKTVHPLDTIEKAIQVMRENSVKKLPVMNNDGIVGIITVTDISNARPDLSKRFIETWIKPVWKD